MDKTDSHVMNLIDFLLRSVWADSSDRKLRSPAAPPKEKSDRSRTNSHLRIFYKQKSSMTPSIYHKFLALITPEPSNLVAIHYQLKTMSKSKKVQ
ncbi:hypothetical protein LC593_26270 [Nostoc sp. CHAB 5844]|nr:hypothetical protein [Nostoc sp. CHAB 5844]